MKKFVEFPKEAALDLRYVLFDIDDTITTEGRLTAEAYAALWALYARGLAVVPVTGRPAGWCDMIIRQWPVHAVIGENGAFAFYNRGSIECLVSQAPQNIQRIECLASQMTGGIQSDVYAELTHPNVIEDAAARLVPIRDACLAKVPGCRVARDQFARRYDLAIDFCEDEPKLGLDVAYAIRDVCESFGAVAKVSSIHVNTWFGKYDKLSMAEMLFSQVFGEDLTTDAGRVAFLRKSIFFGDSPNDAPMFGYFPNACAVANILPFVDKIEKTPAYVTEHESGRGFAAAIKQITDALI